MNQFTIIGTMVKDPEIKSTPTGMKVAEYSVAVSDGKDKQGNQKTNFFNCVAYDKTATVLENYVKKGHKICIMGKMEHQTYKNKEGKTQSSYKVITNQIEMLTTKAQAEAMTSSQPRVSNDDVIPVLDLPVIETGSMPF
jgi:single-strand DNA-binding protein